MLKCFGGSIPSKKLTSADLLWLAHLDLEWGSNLTTHSTTAEQSLCPHPGLSAAGEHRSFSLLKLTNTKPVNFISEGSRRVLYEPPPHTQELTYS